MKLNEALFKSQNKKSANGMMGNEGSEDGNEGIWGTKMINCFVVYLTDERY